MPQSINAVDLAQAMIRCNSVTPADGGTLDVLQAQLDALGFTCHRMTFGGDDETEAVENLYARLGTAQPNFCFAGHTDVVPVGDNDAWTVGPFSGEVRDGTLFGRGASDMKSAIAAFVAACSRYLDDGQPKGSISLLITGDEEGPAINGTRRVLDWIKDRGEIIDACLVGEPTNPDSLGEMIKIGRRGSMTCELTVRGVQGHVAYPHLADNPVTPLVRMLAALKAEPLDDGTEHFQPSNLEIVTVDVGNPATNVIPAAARACFNIRFNDRHTSASLEAWIRKTLDAVQPEYELKIHVTGEAFLTPPGALSDIVAAAVKERLGVEPQLSTTGGTSDARFIKDVAPVAEFGLIGRTMHKVDEHVAVDDIEALTDIYEDVIRRYFAG